MVDLAEYIRGVQLDAESLALADKMCIQRGVNRSELIRALIVQEARRVQQLALPGLDAEGVPSGR